MLLCLGRFYFQEDNTKTNEKKNSEILQVDFANCLSSTDQIFWTQGRHVMNRSTCIQYWLMSNELFFSQDFYFEFFKVIKH